MTTTVKKEELWATTTTTATTLKPYLNLKLTIQIQPWLKYI